jgi:3-oxoacyl-[acyl-carrier protein] reductase
VSERIEPTTKGSLVAGDFAGRRAIVTGGANGIGAAIVSRLTALGASVVVLDIETPASDVRSVHVDLSQADDVIRAASDAVASLGGVDVLVNCAGIAYTSDIRDLDLDRYHHVLAVNLHAPVILMRELGREMALQGFGRIVNVSSVHARVSEPGCISYDVSKAGLEAATRVAALDLADRGVLVNAVAPGFVATRMAITDGMDELDSEWFRTVYVDNAQLPLRRAAQPEEVARAVAWLASADNTYMTGQVITVDGGMTARL